MKCNYQSWRSQHDGIPPSASALQLATLPILSLPSRSSSTLAHNLYYGRGAHIINLIKRSALKIVLLVRQLLTAVTFLSPSFSPMFVLSLSSFHSLTLSHFSFPPVSTIYSLYCYSYSWSYACYSHAFRSLLCDTKTWRFFNAVSVDTTLRIRLFVLPCENTIWSRFSAS